MGVILTLLICDIACLFFGKQLFAVYVLYVCMYLLSISYFPSKNQLKGSKNCFLLTYLLLIWHVSVHKRTLRTFDLRSIRLKGTNLFFSRILLIYAAYIGHTPRTLRSSNIRYVYFKKLNNNICSYKNTSIVCCHFEHRSILFFFIFYAHSLIHKYIPHIAQAGYVSTYTAFAMYVAYVFNRMHTFVPNLEKRRKKTNWVAFLRLLRSDQT